MSSPPCCDPRRVTAVSVLDQAGLRQRVQAVLDAFIVERRGLLVGIHSGLAPLVDYGTDLLAGGKRLRAAFCYWGWRAAGAPDSEEAVRAASALELLQGCALVHDDVMDNSDTRRGQPAAHRRFAELHRSAQWAGDPVAFGLGGAVLLGDLLLSWADELLLTCGLPLPALARGKAVYDVMRTELMGGQYLDLLEQAQRCDSVADALQVARYKSAKYTIERPLHLGSALAGGSEPLIEALRAFGLHLGEAFQLRDDVLGVLGDPSLTGKPAGDDLREGKRTVLVLTALAAATAGQRDVLAAGIGDPRLTDEGVARLREIIVDTGSVDRVESMIEQAADAALDHLRRARTLGMDEQADVVLSELAVVATQRAH